jgi:hypothetical protein
MHFMPDTEEQDSKAETFWPEGYKQVIRDDVAKSIRVKLLAERPFANVYARGYNTQFYDCDEFLKKIADMIAIGAEKGADDAFDEIVQSFLKEASLPIIRSYAHYAEPHLISPELKLKLHQSVIDEYSEDNIYVYAYGVGYKTTFLTFNEYIEFISALVVKGMENGVNDTLENIYRAFFYVHPLLPVRRYPRRLKTW